MLSNKWSVVSILLLLLGVHWKIWVFRVAKGIQQYLMRSHVVANSCWGSPRIFHGIVNRNKFYSQYPVFDGIEGIYRYSKFHLSVSIWLHDGIAIPSNNRQILYMGTSLEWIFADGKWSLKYKMQWFTALGVVTQSPEPEARDQYTQQHILTLESWFLWRE